MVVELRLHASVIRESSIHNSAPFQAQAPPMYQLLPGGGQAAAAAAAAAGGPAAQQQQAAAVAAGGGVQARQARSGSLRNGSTTGK